MKAKNKIIRLRNKHPFMSSSEIGRKVGVTRIYVHNILKKNNLQTNVPKPQNVVYCKVCGDVCTDKGRIHEGECTFKSRFMKLTCSWCKVPFYRRKSIVRIRIKNKLKNIYCTHKCYGEYRKYNAGKQRAY